MSIKGKIDDINHKRHQDIERNKKKSCAPQENTLDRYVDPIRDNSKYHEAGKGDKIRLPGWFSEEVTERLKEIFGGKKEVKEEEKASNSEEDGSEIG